MIDTVSNLYVKFHSSRKRWEVGSPQPDIAEVFTLFEEGKCGRGNIRAIKSVLEWSYRLADSFREDQAFTPIWFCQTGSIKASLSKQERKFYY